MFKLGGNLDKIRNISTVICLPLLLDHRVHKHDDDAGTHDTHDHPIHNEPRRGVGVDRCCQGGRDVDELQSFISQKKSTVDAIPGLSVGQIGS